MTVSPQTLTPPISGGYVGLGLEFKTIPQWMGLAAGAVDGPFVSLVRDLSSRPVIRVGGVSADRSWWPVPGQSRSPGVTYDIGPAWMRAMSTLVSQTNAQLILGLNLEADNIRLAQVEETHFLAGLGRSHIRAFELGNEPELYEIYPWYKLSSDGQVIPWDSMRRGRPVFSRPDGYGVSDYIDDFTRFRSALPGVPIAGLDSGSQFWLSRLPSLLSAEPGLAMVTFHRYGGNGCQKNPDKPNFVSVRHLLGTASSRGRLAGIAAAAQQAHHADAAFQIDELNSAYCDGVPGVSNSFATALWLLDTLFEMRLDGVDGVNLHTFPNAASALFDFDQLDGKWLAVVHPIYYGALMFQRAAPAGSQLLRTSTSSVGAVRVWATGTPDAGLRVLLINDSTVRRATVDLTVPLTTPTAATVTTLTAPTASSTTMVTLGGLSFGPVTRTGRLRCVPPGGWALPPGLPYALAPPRHHAAADVAPSCAEARTIPGHGDDFSVTLRPASATLLSWDSGRTSSATPAGSTQGGTRR